MMIRVAIVEDQEAERSHIADCLEYVAQKEGVQFRITQFENGLAFIGSYEPVYDIVLMDIEMPGLNGMEAARAMRKVDEAVILIFVTSMAQYAVEGYSVDALDFVVKPVNKYSFAIKMKRAVARVPRRAEEYIAVKCEGEVRQLEVSSILYVDIDGHYVVYHTAAKDYKEYGTLKEAGAKLQRGCFVPVNRGCLVNLCHVGAVGKEQVTVVGRKLDISRPQRKNFLASMSAYMGR
jgi:DNA-binding LytR/AlgR family response regulator